MAFFVIDEKAEKERSQAIEKSEQDRARREARHTPKGANTPPGWKAWRRPGDDETDRELLSRQQKGRI